MFKDYDKLVAPATIADAYELNKLVRPEDRREIEDISGERFLTTMLFGLLCSPLVVTARAPNGNLGCIVGVTPYGPGQGAVWMAGTPEIERNKIAFTRGTAEFLRRSSSQFHTLFNVCDSRNEVHVNWLRRTGFSLIRKVENFGAKGVPVIEFARIAPLCATP